MRLPVRLSIWLNDTFLRDTALNSLIGMLTSPKLIDPLQMARGMADSLPALTVELHELRWNYTTPRSLAHRVSSCLVDSWSLRSTADTWVSTVFTEISSRRAISLYV